MATPARHGTSGARARLAALGLALLLAAPGVPAQSVSLAGQMGSKALLVIDGQTKMLAPGESALGVRLVRVDGDGVVVEAGGRQTTLRPGGSPARLAGTAPVGGSREVVIPASPGGHFVVAGAINGRPVQMMVDTGATLVAIGRDDAGRLGIDLRNARSGLSHTANGSVAVQLVTLTALRIGDVDLSNVEAVVMPASMPGVLLGNSALSRFQMRRDNDVMRLTLR